MRKQLVCIITGVLVFAVAAAPVIPANRQGLSIDDVEGTRLDGDPLQTAALRGQVVLVDFWASWCTPCVKAFPMLRELNSKYGDEGFQVVGIAVYSGTLEDVKKAVDKYGLDYTVVVGDDDLIEKFGLIGVPTYFLFDRNGHLARKYVGQTEEFHEGIEAHIRQLLGE